jgi:glycosyltransferase involved in cell wall biosynthesis
MKIVAVIPAYNAENTIGMVVQLASKFSDNVIVINNNSKDKTMEVARNHGAVVFHCGVQGQGAATRKAWDKLRWDKQYDIIVTLDADGQHAPEEIPNVIFPILSGKADVVVGGRFIKPFDAQKLRDLDMIDVPKYRKFGIDVITWLYNSGHKQKLGDSQSCFRAFSSKAIKLLSIQENDFGFSTEMLIRARKLGLRIVEVPITCIYHSILRSNSTMNPIKHGLGVAFKTVYWRVKLWS